MYPPAPRCQERIAWAGDAHARGTVVWLSARLLSNVMSGARVGDQDLAAGARADLLRYTMAAMSAICPPR